MEIQGATWRALAISRSGNRAQVASFNTESQKNTPEILLLLSEWEEQGSRDYPHLSLLHSRSWKKKFFLGIILTKSSCIFGADTTPRVHSLTRKCRLDFSSHFLSQTDHFIQGTTRTTLHGSPGWGLYSAACKVIKNSYQISDLRGICGCFLRLPRGSGVWIEP